MRACLLWTLPFMAALLTAPQTANGACCMSSLPESDKAGLLTCADGPCPGGLENRQHFSYAESPNPAACCDKAATTASGWFYSGPKGTPGCVWPSSQIARLLPQWALPCSGNVCDANATPHVCTITAQDISPRTSQSAGRRRMRHFF